MELYLAQRLISLTYCGRHQYQRTSSMVFLLCFGTTK